MAQQAIGMIECKGLCALLEACDASLKAANVTLVGWEKIGSVAAAGNSNTEKSYSFTDINPQGALLLYRLRQIDIDKTIITSPTISIVTNSLRRCPDFSCRA